MMRAVAVALACGFALSLAASAAAPDCNLVPGWTAQGTVRSYSQDNLFEYMDGNAEGYLLYGFQTMQGVTCEKGGVTLVIDTSVLTPVMTSVGEWKEESSYTRTEVA